MQGTANGNFKCSLISESINKINMQMKRNNDIVLIKRDSLTRAKLNALYKQLLVEWCFTSTETIGLLGTGAQDGHLDFHTAPEL